MVDAAGQMMGPDLQKSADITDFPRFPEGTTSLLSKCLTQEIWEQLKDTKDESGFTFKDAIFSGCKWTNSGVGVYAGSHNSYTVFSPFMDRIIETYHGHKPEDKHIVDMDHTHLNCDDFPVHEAKMIRSTRIRVARNSAEYPIGTSIKREDRKALEGKIVEALEGLDGELKGTYHSLENMSDEVRKQLIEDHFLFKGGDKYLEACGLERDWPEARGIFHNEAKTFLVWVNEEDQLRIISMQQGSNIRQVFERLSIASAAIEAKTKFASDDHLGYITSCPTNLGTGMRASVHIHLPLLQKQPEKMQAIADKYYVQIRGAHGEHTETDDGIFDISNRRRLGRNEVQLTQDMYDGVKALIAAELKMERVERARSIIDNMKAVRASAANFKFEFVMEGLTNEQVYELMRDDAMVELYQKQNEKAIAEGKIEYKIPELTEEPKGDIELEWTDYDEPFKNQFIRVLCDF